MKQKPAVGLDLQAVLLLHPQCPHSLVLFDLALVLGPSQQVQRSCSQPLIIMPLSKPIFCPVRDDVLRYHKEAAKKYEPPEVVSHLQKWSDLVVSRYVARHVEACLVEARSATVLQRPYRSLLQLEAPEIIRKQHLLPVLQCAILVIIQGEKILAQKCHFLLCFDFSDFLVDLNMFLQSSQYLLGCPCLSEAHHLLGINLYEHVPL